MADPTRFVPARRPDLILSPPGDDGQRVVKDPRTRQFFKLGPEEVFLLEQLDGRRTVAAVQAAFQERFGDELSEEDLDGFVELARAQNFLAAAGTSEPAGAPARRGWRAKDLIYLRKSFFDPDKLLNALEPRVRFVWTRGFLVLTLLGMVAAGAVLWSNRDELIAALPGALRWETLVIAWLTLVLATFGHEFAHGLTCKHYGGEVHEVGFLLMMGMPCFYCNVSDAWLFPERYKRLLVTLAGGYFDLCVWAAAVFVWRLTPVEGTLHYVSYVVLTVCGGRVFINFNPFMRLDGYYLLSDWSEIPNLRRRSWERVKARLRWLLWGAEAPAPEPRARFLMVYGTLSWFMSVAYILLMCLAVFHLSDSGGVGGVGRLASVALGTILLPILFKGFTGGEMFKMLKTRCRRTAVWCLGCGGLVAAMFLIQVSDRPGGAFQVRPTVRVELRARVTGFLKEVDVEEGDRVSASKRVALLEVPDLTSKTQQKKAEVRESRAKLRLLELGPRAEEVMEQRYRVERARTWRELARQDLAQARAALKAELAKLDEQQKGNEAELKYADYALKRDRRLYMRDLLPQDQYRDRAKQLGVRQSMIDQTAAQRQALQTRGTQREEAELARRDKEVADAQATLTIMELGTRPEEVEAERARLARLEEEQRYLEKVQRDLPIFCPVDGVVTTPRLKEKIGQYLKEGELICTVDRTSVLEVEVSLDEQEVERIEEGSEVELRPRSFVFRTFKAELSRIAPMVRHGTEAPPEPGKPAAPPPKTDTPGTVTLYCEVKGGEGLLPGMSGFARISCPRRPLAAIALERGMRLLRPEYWW